MKLFFLFFKPLCLFFLLLTSFVSAQENTKIITSFWGRTSDELLWEYACYTYMCSVSPLSVFDNYKTIFPKIMNSEFVYESQPRMNDKNYFAKWRIDKDLLYLYDIRFHDEEATFILKDTMIVAFDPDPKINEIYKKEFANRFKTMEKFLNRKFELVPSINQKAIFADWYSGILYIQKIPEIDERYRNAFIKIYKYEPFFKLVIEKGKIKSIEKASSMIVNQ